MNLSYQEKKIWTSLLITAVFFGYYFINTFSILFKAEVDNIQIVNNFVSIVVLVIIAEIIFQIILAIIFRKEAKEGEDERDKIIKLKAASNAYFFLIAGVWITCLSLLVTHSPILIINLIMCFFILAEITKFTSQLIYYRRGV